MKIAEQGYKHETVQSRAEEWARGGNPRQHAGGLLLDPQAVDPLDPYLGSAKHMPKYLAEFEYRMNMRRVPKLMFDLMLSFRQLSTPKDVLEAPSSA